eukprot:TRINITY_DN6137_c0_g1_i1.p1 TRINITY_DN6137_c0_g1~~TRINITY_DN6137_c0_g1_i1.p1  ORF type:complete len:339 (+),score=66.47 TRINITY_DN6137_c0_g1_i1:169-1185(+)
MRRALQLLASLPAEQAAARAVSSPLTRQQALRAVDRAQTPTELHAIVKEFRDSKPQHGQVAFINAVMDRVADLDSPVDLATFDTLLDVFPKNASYKTRSLLDAIWPKESLQSTAALRVLQFMEDDGLIPESSTHAVLLETFGRASAPVKKVTYMAYWMRRYYFSNPFALPRQLPETDEEWMGYALKRYVGHQAHVEAFDITGTVKLKQPTALYAMNDEQHEMLTNHNRLSDEAQISIEGRHRGWISGRKQHYLSLVARHDGAEHVLAVCTAEVPVKPSVGVVTKEERLLQAAVGQDDNVSERDFEVDDWRRVASLWMNALSNGYPGFIRRYQVLIQLA